MLKDDLSFCFEAKVLSLLFFCFDSQLHPWQPRLPPKTCQSLRPSSRGHSWLERVSNATLFWGISVLIDSPEESRRHRLLFEEGIFARIYWWSVHRGSIWSLWNWFWFWNVVIVYILWTYLSCPTASPATCGELELRRRNRGREDIGHKGKGRRRGRDLKGSQRGGWIGVVIHVSISFQRSPLKIAGEHLSGKKDKIYVRRRGQPTKQLKVLILKSLIKPEN